MEVRGGGNLGGLPTRPNSKLVACQLLLVAAVPLLQDFHPGKKVGGCPPPWPPRLLRPCMCLAQRGIGMVLPKFIKLKTDLLYGGDGVHWGFNVIHGFCF